ncbi:glutamate formimidoyltransferase [Saccharicrinis fermentans]|uniref:Formimidoyltransferase-cyclodeaminase n=1 Tax=Saccharicrinis fermentans DSM 9555 = JCM 21142 TaxID=869213 RepID=W7XYM0_9BACT|nr:glutamate formimidoyltransferase [Saccharicrinis fermentans]GAF03725.1 methenyltetrahydrofolate cyclohydrolase [Saccharicrinis fermentans DSM 9555 = JCM 21142]
MKHMQQLIECVPNFSEGRDMNVIHQIADEVKKVEGVRLIDVDPGKATNRTVVTMVGTPDEVLEAAFRAVKKAKELIDMRKHKGAHPRFGATDVCPLVPVSNITMDEVVVYARRLAKRLADELNIPIYCYEYAAQTKERRNLAECRKGEYEALGKRIESLDWKPDFGSCHWDEETQKSGATAVGARNFLIAYNINLNTTSTRRANAVAFDMRERGRVKREGGSLNGKIIRDEKGDPVNEPGLLKCVKGIGWYIEEYGIAQISLNLTDISITSMHKAFDVACQRASARGLRVTGSELVGVVPLKAILDAGKYFLRKQNRSIGIADEEIIKIAVKSLGLDELYPFEPDKKIIEYILQNETKQNSLVDKSMADFVHETASESPAPGGGSVSAYLGALGSALGTMVANLSSHKRGWDSRVQEFSDWAEKGKYFHDELLKMVDEDTHAFNKIMDALQMPKMSDEEKRMRQKAIESATKYAIEVPFKTMQLCYDSMDVMLEMAKVGNSNSVSDAGVGALCARSGVLGAWLNVRINAKGLQDKVFVEDVLKMGQVVVDKAKEKEVEILKWVDHKIDQ